MSIYISVNWAGKLLLWEQNKRACKCKMCECELKAAEGFQFRKARISRLESGYVCKKCVAGFLMTSDRWHWNKLMGCLFPAISETMHPFRGVDLAAAWKEGGIQGLEEMLK